MNLQLGNQTALVTASFGGTGEAIARSPFHGGDPPTSLIGNFVAFLSSPLASAINGAALRADGGLVRSAF